jgi:peptidoglycan/LPS O-acetylase OafA/YrhL
MKRDSNLLIVALVCFALAIVGTVGLSYAQPGPVTPVVPGIDNPLPIDNWDVVAAVQSMMNLFKTAWYLGLAFVFYLLVNFVRGKLELFGKVIKIAKLSDWFDGKGKAVKICLIIGFCGLGSMFVSFKDVTAWTLWPVVKTLGGGFIGGVSLAMAAMGFNNIFSVWEEIKTAKADATPTSPVTPP